MPDNSNRRIAEWLGVSEYAEHDWRIPRGDTVFKCRNCGWQRGAEGKHCRKQPLKYDTDPAACLALIEACREKGYTVHLNAYGPLVELPYRIDIRQTGEGFASADTLPVAVQQAVLKLIMSEGK